MKTISILSTIMVLVLVSSCNETLNPIPNIYRTLTKGDDFITLKKSGSLSIKLLKYENHQKLTQAKVKVTLSGKIEYTLTADTSGIVSVPISDENLTGYCNVEVCFSSNSEQYYGNSVIYLNEERDSKVLIYVNRGHCERKFIKMF